MPDSFSWFIDVINTNRVSGWCFNNEAPHTPCDMSFFVDDHKIGSTIADAYREDLKNLKFHPTGICGFEYIIPAQNNVLDYTNFRIHANAAAEPLKEISTTQIPDVLRGELPKVFFMHIPKTAGTSFNTLANTIYPQDEAVVHLESIDPKTYPALQTEKHYLAGHLPLRKIKAHFDLSRFDLYTIVREPYAHLHSHLKWVRRIGQNPNADFFASHSAETQQLSLLLNKLDFSKHQNVQALLDGICGDLITLFDNHQTRYFLDYKRKKVTTPDRQIAQAELQRFKSIGLTEQYQQFVARFCHTYGVSFAGQAEKLNQSESPPLFDYRDSLTQSILYPLVEHDLVLYQRLSGDWSE